MVISNARHQQRNNYKVQRCFINKFSSVVSRMKSSDRVKHFSFTVLQT